MKKVIFICLLSLSVCLSNPTAPPAAPVPQTPQQQASNVPPADQKAQPPKPAEQPSPTNVVHTEAQNAVKTEAASTAVIQKVDNQNKIETPPPAAPPASGAKPTDTKINTKDSDAGKTKGTDPPKNEETKVTPPKDATVSTTDKGTTDSKTTAKNDTKPTDNGGTTPKTEASTKASEKDEVHVVQARGFDGPSFIGGIILTLGLLAIGFMGFKYYKNQTERNYHTL